MNQLLSNTLNMPWQERYIQERALRIDKKSSLKNFIKMSQIYTNPYEKPPKFGY